MALCLGLHAVLRGKGLAVAQHGDIRGAKGFYGSELCVQCVTYYHNGVDYYDKTSPHNRNTYRIANNSQRGRALDADSIRRIRDTMHRIPMRTGSRGGGMSQRMRTVGFGVIEMVESFGHELTSIVASNLDEISERRM